MNSPVISPEAEDDLAEAKHWYNRQRDGLGDEFVVSVEEALERIGRMPTAHAILYKDIRRSLLRRFPYAIYYRIEDDQVIVVAIMHQHRHPRHWQERA